MATQAQPRKKITGWIVFGMVLVVAFVCWRLAIDVNPVVNVPSPAVPKPNARDFYLKARADFVSSTIATASGPYALDIAQVETLLGRKAIGTGPGIAVLNTTGRAKDELIPSRGELQALMRLNAPALATLRKGFQYTYQDRPFRSFGAQTPQYTTYQSLARCLSIDACAKRLGGDWNGAVNDGIDALRLGRDIPKGAPEMAMLAGISVQSIGRKDLWQTIEHLDGPQARAALTRLEEIRSSHTACADVLQEEKWYNLAALSEAFRKPGWRSVLAKALELNTGNPFIGLEVASISKRRIINDYTRYVDTQIANMKLPYPAAPKAEPPLPDDSFAVALVPSSVKLQYTDANNETQNNLLTVTVALRAFAAERGHYPAALTELVPAYLKALPADLFAQNGTILYKQTGKTYVLYSVGPDGKDDGGTPVMDGKTPKAFWSVAETDAGDIVAGVNAQ